MTVRRSTRLYSWNTIPMRRRAWRSARPESLARSWPRKRISPAVGSTRRLMQRISVDLPVPDGPMTAVMPRPGMARSMSFSTGTPGRYSLRSLRMRSARASPSLVAATTAGAAVIASSVPRPSCAPPRPRGPPLLVGSLVVGRSGILGHLAHDRPILLVGDRQEAVVAVELLRHLRREAEIVKALLDLRRELRLEIVRIGEGRGRE